MLKKLTSLSLAGAILLCPVGRLSYAATNEEIARKIAAVFAESEKESQQKLGYETEKRQKLENENKALAEELQKLKAEKENKELQQAIEELKKNKDKSKSPSIWSTIKTWFRNITGVLGGLIAAVVSVLGIGAGVAGVWTAGSAAYDCYSDDNCNSFTEKMTKDRFMNSFKSITNFILEIAKHIDVVLVKDADK